MHLRAKSLTMALCAIGLAIGAWLLWPNAASAQINIPGIMFGAVGQYHYGSGAYRGHRRVHESRHERRSHKGDNEEADKGSATNGKPDPVPDDKSLAAAPDNKPAAAPVENKPAETAATNVPAAANNDQPSFSPSR